MTYTHVEISAERFCTRLLSYDNRFGAYRLGELRAFAQMLFSRMEECGAISPDPATFREFCYLNHIRPIKSSYVRLYATCESSGILKPFDHEDKRLRLSDNFLEFCQQEDGGTQYLLPFSLLAVEGMKAQEEFRKAYCG